MIGEKIFINLDHSAKIVGIEDRQIDGAVRIDFSVEVTL